jgi:hypothetical protein
MTTNTTQKATGAINTNGLHTSTNGTDFRTSGAIEQAQDGKAIATQIACLALAGHAVHQLHDVAIWFPNTATPTTRKTLQACKLSPVNWG